MSIGDLMEQMARAGAPIEAILLAVRALEAEQNKAAEKRAQAAARKRAQRERDSHATVTGQSQDTPSLEVSPHTPLPKPSPESAPLNPPKKRKREAIVVQVPEWVPAEPWLEFVAMRKAMRNVPFRDAAARGVIEDLDKLRGEGHCPAKLLRKAVTRGWRTVFGGDDTLASGPGQPVDLEKLRKANLAAAETYDRMGRTDEAAEIRRKWGPDPPERIRRTTDIGSIASKLVQQGRG